LTFDIKLLTYKNLSSKLKVVIQKRMKNLYQKIHSQNTNTKL
jgi:hypothetical protein